MATLDEFIEAEKARQESPTDENSIKSYLHEFAAISADDKISYGSKTALSYIEKIVDGKNTIDDITEKDGFPTKEFREFLRNGLATLTIPQESISEVRKEISRFVENTSKPIPKQHDPEQHIVIADRYDELVQHIVNAAKKLQEISDEEFSSEIYDRLNYFRFNNMENEIKWITSALANQPHEYKLKQGLKDSMILPIYLLKAAGGEEKKVLVADTPEEIKKIYKSTIMEDPQFDILWYRGRGNVGLTDELTLISEKVEIYDRGGDTCADFQRWHNEFEYYINHALVKTIKDEGWIIDILNNIRHRDEIEDYFPIPLFEEVEDEKKYENAIAIYKDDPFKFFGIVYYSEEASEAVMENANTDIIGSKTDPFYSLKEVPEELIEQAKFVINQDKGPNGTYTKSLINAHNTITK